LGYFVVIWYISSRFGMLYQEKFGKPVNNLAEKVAHMPPFGDFYLEQKSFKMLRSFSTRGRQFEVRTVDRLILRPLGKIQDMGSWTLRVSKISARTVS
jgi:hypothetical protein